MSMGEFFHLHYHITCKCRYLDFFSSNLYHFDNFHYFIALVMTKVLYCRYEKSWQLCLVSNFRKIVLTFSLFLFWCQLWACCIYDVKVYSLYPQYLQGIFPYHVWGLDFCQRHFLHLMIRSCVFILQFVYMTGYVIDLDMLMHSCTSRVKPIWSWYMFFFNFLYVLWFTL